MDRSWEPLDGEAAHHVVECGEAPLQSLTDQGRRVAPPGSDSPHSFEMVHLGSDHMTSSSDCL